MLLCVIYYSAFCVLLKYWWFYHISITGSHIFEPGLKYAYKLAACFGKTLLLVLPTASIIVLMFNWFFFIIMCFLQVELLSICVLRYFTSWGTSAPFIRIFSVEETLRFVKTIRDDLFRFIFIFSWSALRCYFIVCCPPVLSLIFGTFVWRQDRRIVSKSSYINVWYRNIHKLE